MPNRDGTGPCGLGAKTGRKAGVCVGAEKQETTAAYGRGWRCTRGQGRRRRQQGAARQTQQ